MYLVQKQDPIIILEGKIEELEKEKSVEELPTEDTAQQSDVVTVKITSGETQNLEDWLDDFLDD